LVRANLMDVHDRTRLWQTPGSSRYAWQDQAHILSHQRHRLHLMVRYFPSSRYAKSVPVVLLSMVSVLAAYISLTARGSVLILRECRKLCCTVPARGVLLAAWGRKSEKQSGMTYATHFQHQGSFNLCWDSTQYIQEESLLWHSVKLAGMSMTKLLR